MVSPHAWFLSDLDKIPQNGIKVMTTFSGGGGSSMGYKLAGCDVVAANDIDPDMAYHYNLNLKTKHYFLCSIRDLLTADLPPELFDLDILDGSPPCSTFSVAGSREKSWGKRKKFREGQSKQVLSELFFDYLDLIDRLKPRVAIAENVKGMIIGNAKGYIKMIVEKFKKIGYKSQLFLINAADCGVPQKRERLFFCALRSDIKAPPLILKPNHRWISARDAVADIENLTAKELEEAKLSEREAKYWKMIEPGKNLASVLEKIEGKRSCFNQIRVNGNKPCNTLVASGRLYHWEYPRLLTFRERKRLNSFPDDYKAVNGRIGNYIIGMSVPPKMICTVAEAIISQWLKHAVSLDHKKCTQEDPACTG